MVVRVGVGCMIVWVEVVVLGVLVMHVDAGVVVSLVYLRRQSIEDKTQVKVVTKYFVLSK
jgi:hypothetical protein